MENLKNGEIVVDGIRYVPAYDAMAKDYKNANPRVFNVTKWDVELGMNSKPFNFGPQEAKEIWDTDIIRHLTKWSSGGHKGVVHLVYNESMQKKFPSFKEFYREQVKTGIKNIRKTIEEALTYEEQAISEVHARKGTVSDKKRMGTERFEKQLAEINEWEKEYLKKWIEEDKEELSNIAKVSGETNVEVVDESTDNQDQGKAKVGRGRPRILD